jgi:hypothetical protein
MLPLLLVTVALEDEQPSMVTRRAELLLATAEVTVGLAELERQ